MTTRNKKSKNKQLLALLLCGFMLTSTAATFAACGSSKKTTDVDQTELTDDKTDDARITNGSFEFFDDNDGKNLVVTSPTGWTKSSSSKRASGIVNTEADAWKKYTETSAAWAASEKKEADAKANWSTMTIRDKLEFKELWEDEDDDNDVDDLSYYDASKDSSNVEFSDIKNLTAELNPGTHYAANAENEETSVLMLQNYATDGKGTTGKFTSGTTVTIQPGTSAEFSVWVKTANMTYDGKSDEAGRPVYEGADRGAYIGVTHTVGGETLDEMRIKNINTEYDAKAKENNGWVEYTVYLKGCSYATSTFTIVLGLGEGSSDDKYGYVDGFAFFDDAKCTIIENKDFPTTAIPTVTANSDAEDKLFLTNTDDASRNGAKGKYEFAIDLYSDFTSLNVNVTGDLTDDNGKNCTNYGDLNIPTTGDFKQTVKVSDISGSTEIATAVKNAVKDYPFAATDNALVLMSKSGAAYTAKLDEITLAPEQRTVVTFFLKTSDLNGFTGAGVTIEETTQGAENTTSLSSLDTTSIQTVDVDGTDGKIEDVYKGWQQCFVFVENESETETRKFQISLTYGVREIIGSTGTDYYPGFAIFTNFSENNQLTEAEYDRATAGTYTAKLSLVGSGDVVTDAGFDSASPIPEKEIETTLADPKNYTGVVGGSKYVVKGGTNEETNANDYAGLLNKKYAANYRAENDDWYQGVLAATGVADGENWWKDVFGTSTQPLVIYNKEAGSYGYFGAKTTLEANGSNLTPISVKVKTNGTANVYLIDADSKTETLKFSTVKYVYWYDEDGNVCVEDPNGDDFDEKTDIAFKLNEKNGLYEVNPKWAHAANYTGKFYANLKNYEVDEETGNLLVAENGVEYKYTDKWLDQGNDGVAFYHKDGKYYAYENYTTEVFDFTTVTELPARYDYSEATERSLQMTVTDTQGEWVTCTFYVKTGSQAKNYRLEVWSGNREGTLTNAAGTYVFFDASKPSAPEDYAKLVEGEIEYLKGKMPAGTTDEEFKAKYSDVTYFGYSFYDSPTFLRYDSTLDKNKVGNSYASYNAADSTTYPEGVAYLYSVNADDQWNKMFVDFSYTEVTVAADVEEEEADKDTTTNTTSGGDTNVALLVSSLVVAIALIFAVVAIIVRKLVKKMAKKKKAKSASTQTSEVKRRYSAKKAEKARKAAEKQAEKQAEKEAESKEKEDENNPYND